MGAKLDAPSIQLERVGGKVRISNGRGLSFWLSCEDIECGVREAVAALTICQAFDKHELYGKRKLRRQTAELLYELCLHPEKIDEAAGEGRKSVSAWLRLCHILREALRQQPFPAAFTLIQLQRVMLKIERKKAGARFDPTAREYVLVRARELVTVATEYIRQLGAEQQDKLERDLQSAVEGLERYWQEQLELAARFIEDWALIARMDLCLAQEWEGRVPAAWPGPIARCAERLGQRLRGLRSLTWGLAWAILSFIGVFPFVNWKLGLHLLEAWTFYAWAAGLGMGFLFLLALWPHWGRAWATRLGAVSVLGYAALLSLPVSGLNESPYWWQYLLLPLVAVGLTFAYLWLGQARKRIANPRIAIARAGKLLLSGLAQSWAIGAAGYWLLTSQIEDKLPIFAVWGPLALLVGLIVQSLWAKEAITEPI